MTYTRQTPPTPTPRPTLEERIVAQLPPILVGLVAVVLAIGAAR